MVDPTTTNILLSVPTRGSDAGTWDLPVNGNSSALDGYFGGVQPVSLASSPLTLSAPSGTPTPGAGPTQAQNAVLRFTGALGANVVVTLPLPGYYIIENLTTGAFTLTLRGTTATQVIAVEQGAIQHIYNDSANVRFVNLSQVGAIEIWAGYTAIPAWITACTVPPFLLCDGSIYNFSTYPYLGARFGSLFGGNGITTFGVPDLRGRVPLPYDGTGTRITTAVAGINGQTLGASGGSQGGNLAANQVPTLSGITGSNSITVSSANAGGTGSTIPHGGSLAQSVQSGVGGIAWDLALGPTVGAVVSTNPTQTITVAYTNSSQVVVNNVQPAQVTGIAVIRAA